MDRLAVTTVLALAAIAFLAGGAAAGITGLVARRPAVVSLAFVAAVVVIALLGTAWSRERTGTPYW